MRTTTISAVSISYCAMVLPCNLTTSYRGYNCQTIEDVLHDIMPGSVLTLIVCIIGFVHNILWLTVAYRIEWFGQIQLYLVINQSIVDLLTSFAFGLAMVRSIAYSSTQTPDGMTTFDCTLIYLSNNILFTCSQRCAFVIAFDRLYFMVVPVHWLKRTDRYRYGLIAFAWFESIVGEVLFLFNLGLGFDYSTDRYDIFGVPACMPRSTPNVVVNAKILYQVLNAIDDILSALIILFYAVIPGLALTICRRVTCGQSGVINVYMSDRGMERIQRDMLAQVRWMSFAMLFTYVCTMFVGTLLIDYLWMYFDSDAKYLIQPLAMALSLLNTIPPLYVFCWKDPGFREELRKMCRLGYK